jgi:hypothetical protein
MRIALSSLGLAAFGAASLFAMSGAAASTTREIREARCDRLETENGRVVTIEAPELHVLRDTAAGGRYQPGLAGSVASIMCSRNSIIPAAHDDEVIWLGMPLHIAQLGSPGRLAVLEINEGRYRYRMIEGRAPNPEEQAAIDARLAEFQARFPPTQ